jgi:hypothetical protein
LVVDVEAVELSRLTELWLGTERPAPGRRDELLLVAGGKYC